MTIINPGKVLSDEELASLFSLEDVPLAEQEQISAVLKGQDSIVVPDALAREDSTPEVILSAECGAPTLAGEGDVDGAVATPTAEGDEQAKPLRMDECTMPEKIKLAMFGNAAARAYLIRDGSKLVQMFVLKNPRVQLNEIEEFSRNPNLSEHVLRAIGSNQSWTKSYMVKVHLVFNPKTPSDVALKWVRYLNAPDIKKLSKSRNVPQVIVTVARRKLEEMAR